MWLPDFKFGPGRCAMSLAKTPWYWETVTGNLAHIHDCGENFTIRHLVMPNHVECCTYPVLDWLAEHMPEVPINIMDQYHPDNFAIRAAQVSSAIRRAFASPRRRGIAQRLSPRASLGIAVRDGHFREVRDRIRAWAYWRSD